MLRRILNMLAKLVRSLFASAPVPRESEKARGGHEYLLARISAARSRIKTVQDQLEHGVASTQREAAGLLDEARCLVEAGRDDAARVVLHRRQTALERLRLLDSQLARIVLEDHTLASAGDRLEGEMALQTARQGVSEARYDAAEARAKVTEALTDVSDECSDLLAELWAADERAESMEARADALDELVEIGVLSSYAPPSHLTDMVSHSEELETVLEQIRHEIRLEQPQSKSAID